MTFVSLAYALLLPLVFVLVWWPLHRSIVGRNIVLLAASYFFYAWWDWRFAGLLLLSTLVSWGCALPGSHRCARAALSVAVNLGILVAFKYLGFFAENLRWLFANFGWEMDWFTVRVLLPVGISFYTFQAVGYSIDVLCGRVAPERNLLNFSLYIAFFPQLVAGPIESASRMLPQFRRIAPFDYGEAVEGMRRILWGLFKKVVVADGIAPWVDAAYGGDVAPGLGGSVSAGLTVWFFLIQIYADFSGYCDIARGSAQLLGFRLSDNFLFPLYSRNAREMWRRWNRTLMEWFRTYVYIPMGGSRSGNKYVNMMVVFLLSGLWHGADWTFVVWGLLGGGWLVLSVAGGCANYKLDSPVATRRDAHKIVLTCLVRSVNCVIMRADSLAAGGSMLVRAAPGLAATAAVLLAAAFAWRAGAEKWLLGGAAAAFAASVIMAPVTVAVWLTLHLSWLAAAAMLVVEWHARTLSFGLARVPRNTFVRMAVYMLLGFLIYAGAAHSESQFIYYRF